MIQTGEIIPIASQPVDELTHQLLADIARTHLESQAVGSSAIQFLALLGRLQNHAGHMSPSYHMRPEAAPAITPNLIDWGLTNWDSLPGPFGSQHRPFTPALRYDGVSTDEELSCSRHNWSLVAGVANQQDMAVFLTAKGLNRHRLRGTLGKIYDTMSIASGLLEKPRTPEFEAEQPLEFISSQDFYKQMKGAGLKSHGRHAISVSLHRNIHFQLTSGKPAPEGETVLDGALTFRGDTGFTITYERIAVSSLAPLSVNIPDHISKPARDFLQAFG